MARRMFPLLVAIFVSIVHVPSSLGDDCSTSNNDFGILYAGQTAFSVSQANGTCACGGPIESTAVRLKQPTILSNADCTSASAGTIRSDGTRLLFCDGTRFWLLSFTATISITAVSPAALPYNATNAVLTLTGPGVGGAVSVAIGGQVYTSIIPVDSMTARVVLPTLPASSGTYTVTVMDNFGYTSNGTTFRVYGDGSTAALAESHCLSFMTYGTGRGNGLYYVSAFGTVQQVYCDMTSAGGGWTRCANAATTSLSFSTAVTTTITSNYNFCSLVPAYATTAKMFAVGGVPTAQVLSYTGYVSSHAHIAHCPLHAFN
eukprot:TRINITY_DN902_c0_g2_i2.p1 TRINITY_DN902_c0_g2~~TRINITY_DN902_c0_g2_i2.p1  ORF type:complete len:317 (-),score=63.35 TRINITY_DN902_c0_g2_i2:200-1150(-)